jgi:hypothetical protein
MQAQVAFYRDVLGLEVGWPDGSEDYGSEHWITFNTAGATLALHSGAVETSGTPARFGWQVEDIAGWREKLVGHGVRCGDVREAAPGIQVLDCWDPETNPFFLEQRDRVY